VPVVLDLGKSNYSKWRMLVTVLLGKYKLSDHDLIETPEANRTAEWNQEDFIVRSWLYGSISEEILDIIMVENQTAHDVYMLIRNLFLDNQMTRAIHLEAELCALIQGDLSVTASRLSLMRSATSASLSPTRPWCSPACAASTRTSPTSPPW
jgi:hypothetical protein